MRTRGFALVVVIAAAVLCSALSAYAAPLKLTVGYRSNPQIEQWLTDVSKAFEKRNPHIEVELLSMTGGQAYIEKLTMLFASGEAPDIFWGAEDKPGFINNGWTMDIAPYVTRDAQELRMQDFFPPTIAAWKRGNALYALPISIDHKGLFLNKQLLKEAGLSEPSVDWEDRSWTWERMREYARKLTRINSQGTADQFGVSVQWTGCWGVDLVWAFGGDWITPESYQTGLVQGIAVDQPANARAYSELLDMMRMDPVNPGGSVAWTSKTSNSFVEGKLAMEWRASWKMTNYANQLKFEWGLAPYPLAVSRDNTLFIDPLFISSTTKHPDAAWEFVKFATNPENLTSMASIMQAVPARMSVTRAYIDFISQRTGMSRQDVLTDLNGAMKYARSNQDGVLHFTAIQRVIQTALQPVWAGKTSVEAALKTAQKEAEVRLASLKVK